MTDDVKSIGKGMLVNNSEEDARTHYLIQCVIGRHWHRAGVQHESLSQKCKKTVRVHDFHLSPVETGTHTQSLSVSQTDRNRLRQQSNAVSGNITFWLVFFFFPPQPTQTNKSTPIATHCLETCAEKRSSVRFDKSIPKIAHHSGVLAE